ncbi:MAG: pseudouridine synthase [Lachnospiraceae bacterium]
MIRLDKYLADMSIGTRTEVKDLIRKGMVTIDGIIVKRPEQKIELAQQQIAVQSHIVGYVEYEYYMLNKPAGVVSATCDKKETTVLDLITERKRKDLFPVGRLDKDTEGLLLITNDGNLAHQLLSPKKHVNKVYYAKIRGIVTKEDVVRFAQGLQISDREYTKPAILEIVKEAPESEIKLTIQEGKFHQVKRMFQVVDKEVLYLKRISMGTLQLDDTLSLGDYRPLTKEELNQLC